jgi:hypothetical protein
MSSSFSQFMSSLVCFRRKKAELTVGKPITYSIDPKEPHQSSRSLSTLAQESPISEKPKDDLLLHAEPTEIILEPEWSNPSLLVTGKGQYEIREQIISPSHASSGEVIIRTQAVGLNPIDWKSVDYGFCLPEFPWITGREMAGVIEHIGPDVADLKVGQRVWTSMYPPRLVHSCR